MKNISAMILGFVLLATPSFACEARGPLDEVAHCFADWYQLEYERLSALASYCATLEPGSFPDTLFKYGVAFPLDDAWEQALGIDAYEPVIDCEVDANEMAFLFSLSVDGLHEWADTLPFLPPDQQEAVRYFLSVLLHRFHVSGLTG